MTKPSPTPLAPSASERVWRRVFFILSAAMAASALVDFEAGRFAHGLGDLGVSVLMLSLIVQFPFVRAVVTASQGGGRPEDADKRRQALLQQAEQVRTANPWAEHAGRAGWVLLALSLILRVTGAA